MWKKKQTKKLLHVSSSLCVWDGISSVSVEHPHMFESTSVQLKRTKSIVFMFLNAKKKKMDESDTVAHHLG